MFDNLKAHRHHMTPKLYAAFTGIFLFAGCLMFAGGVGFSSIINAAFATRGQAIALASKALLPTLPDSSKKVSFSVEIVRDGVVICSAPEVKISDNNVSQGRDKVINCPSLQDGDAVRATWSKTTQVNISYR